MKRLLLPLAVLASMVILTLATRAPEVYACSVGPDFDLVQDSDLIVAGRFTDWDLDTDWRGTQVLDPEQTGGMVFAYAGIRAKMLVDRVLKGSAPPEITVTSGNSVNVYDHEPKYVWVGPSGACGAFGEDPTGKYAIMGLSKEDDGGYGAFIFSWFYSGDNPPSDFESRSLGRLKPLLPASQEDFPTLPAAALAIVGPLAFLAGAAFLWRRGEPHNG